MDQTAAQTLVLLFDLLMQILDLILESDDFDMLRYCPITILACD
jgi:hypothetical protein